MNQAADVLIEALPYIRRFHNRRIVIKYGGAAMEEDALIHSVMEDIVLSEICGYASNRCSWRWPKNQYMDG